MEIPRSKVCQTFCAPRDGLFKGRSFRPSERNLLKLATEVTAVACPCFAAMAPVKGCLHGQFYVVWTWEEVEGGCYGTRLAREAVDAPSLAVFKARLDWALSNLV